MVTISIMLATIMQALDTTIANVALPHMQGSLQSSQDQISWVLTSYIVAAAIATPLTGWLCSAFGRRKVFLATVLGFTIASALCGLAGSLCREPGPNSVPRPNWALLHPSSPSAAEAEGVSSAGSFITSAFSWGVALELVSCGTLRVKLTPFGSSA